MQGHPSGGNARSAGDSQSGHAGTPRQSASALAGPSTYTTTQGQSTANVSSTGYPQGGKALPYRQAAPNPSRIDTHATYGGQAPGNVSSTGHPQSGQTSLPRPPAPGPAGSDGYTTQRERMPLPAPQLRGGDREEYPRRPAQNAPPLALVHGHDLSEYFQRPTTDIGVRFNTFPATQTWLVSDPSLFGRDDSGEHRRDHAGTGADQTAPSSVGGTGGGSNGNLSSDASGNARRAAAARRRRH